MSWILILLTICYLSVAATTCNYTDLVEDCPGVCDALQTPCRHIPQAIDPQTGKPLLEIATFLPFLGGVPLGPTLLPIIQMAIDECNENSSLLPNYTVRLLPNIDTQCSPALALIAAVSTNVANPNLVAAIGELCSPATEPQALLGPLYNMTQISPASTDPALSNKQLYPYFLRDVSADTLQGQAWAAICVKNGWNTVSVLYSRENLHTELTQAFLQVAPNYNITVSGQQNFDGSVGADMTSQLTAIKATATNVIFMACYCADARTVFRQAAGLGMVGPPYVYIGTDSWITDCTVTVASDSTDLLIPMYLQNYQVQQNYPKWLFGNAGFNPSAAQSAKATAVLDKYKQITGFTDANITSYVSYAYDAAYTLIYGLQYMFYERDPPWEGPTDGVFRSVFYQAILDHVNFTGITPGRVAFDSVGDRNGLYDFMYWGAPSNGNTSGGNTSKKRDVDYDSINGIALVKSETWDPQSNTWQVWTPVVWPDNTTNIPIDISPFSYYHVNPVLQIVFMTLACVAMIIVACFFVLTLKYWNHSRIRASTPTFMLLICFSTELALSIVLVIGVTPTNATCVIPHWFGHVAFYLAFSCLFFKTARVYYIFSSLDPGRKGGLHKPVTITNSQLLGIVIFPVIGVMIYLACFTALDSPVASTKTDSDDPLTIIQYCLFNNDWIIALYLVEAILLLLCLVLAWQTRKIELLRFNESSHISICIYCLLIIGIILVPNVHWLTTNNDTLFVLESVCIIIACLTINFALFVPKFRAILSKKVDTDETHSSSNRSQSRASKVTTNNSPTINLKTDIHKTPQTTETID